MNKTDRTRPKALLFALLAAVSFLPAQAADESGDKRMAELDKIVGELQQAQSEFRKQFVSLKSDAERSKFYFASSPDKQFTERFYALAKANPKDKAGEGAEVWLMQNAWQCKHQDEVMKWLTSSEHLQSPIMVPLCMALGRFYAPEREKFLQKVIEKSTDESVRGFANLALAKMYEEQSPEKAEAIYKTIVKDYKGVRVSRMPQSLDQMAAAQLAAISHLGIGKMAPALEGEDISGKKLALSEFKGKIVLVDFFGDW